MAPTSPARRVMDDPAEFLVDAAFEAAPYLIEALMGFMGHERRRVTASPRHPT